MRGFTLARRLVLAALVVALCAAITSCAGQAPQARPVSASLPKTTASPAVPSTSPSEAPVPSAVAESAAAPEPDAMVPFDLSRCDTGPEFDGSKSGLDCHLGSPQDVFVWQFTSAKSFVAAFGALAAVHGHEKVPTGGQVKVPVGGRVMVPGA
jgi:hypothetical protein